LQFKLSVVTAPNLSVNKAIRIATRVTIHCYFDTCGNESISAVIDVFVVASLHTNSYLVCCTRGLGSVLPLFQSCTTSSIPVYLITLALIDTFQALEFIAIHASLL